MKLKTLVAIALVACLVFDFSTAQIRKKKKILRRRIQKQPQPQEVIPEVAVEAVEDIRAKPEVQPDEERIARGFLDDYYKQFDKRILSGEEDDSEAEASSVSSVPLGYEVVNPFVHTRGGADQIAVGSVHVVQNPYEDQAPEERQHQYLSDDLIGDNYVVDERIFTSHQSAPSYSTSGLHPTAYTLPSSPSYGASIPAAGPSYTQKDLASKYFGLATTQSQDIQLGLTFTVPFLSIPLNGLTNLFNGAGLGDLFNFDFDSGNLVTIAVIALGAIFIVPQAIYWLTGVNLSAFNWGRSKFNVK